MKTKNALKGIMILTLAFFLTNVMSADEKKKTTQNQNQQAVQVDYTLDAADNTSYFERDPGIDELTNYPEPFSSSTSIQYNLSATGYVNLKIYFPNRIRVIEVFARSFQKKGSHIVEFNASGFPPGEYLCELIFEGNVIYETMLKKSQFSQKKYLED